MNVELRSIDHQVGDGADGPQMPSLRAQGSPHGGARSQRVRAARLAKAAKQDWITGFEKDNARRNDSPHRLQNRRQLLELRTLAHVNHQRRARNFARLQGQFGEARNEFDRQIVDAVKAEIFKRLQGRGFARPAHPRNDDQFGTVAMLMLAVLAPSSANYPARHALAFLCPYARTHAANLSILHQPRSLQVWFAWQAVPEGETEIPTMCRRPWAWARAGREK